MKSLSIIFLSVLLISTILFVQSCSTELHDKNELTAADEVAIGQSIHQALLQRWQKDSTIVLLSMANYPVAYKYINNLQTQIKNTPYLNQSTTIHLLHNKNTPTANAFVAPGGHIYVYNGLLQTLNYESQLMGILTSLTACSESKAATQKLTTRFSIPYMIDLALGGNVDNIDAVLTELQDIPYDSTWVAAYDEKSMQVLCAEGYNIQGYADLFFLQSNLKWMQLFPRANTFGQTLFNRQDSTDCFGSIDNEIAYKNMLGTLPQ